MTAPSTARRSKPQRTSDPLLVMSVEKAFRVLTAFGTERPTMSLSQVAAAAGMEVSAAQRFTHTLLRLGYLKKNPQTKRFELTSKTLELGYHFMRGSSLIGRALPYLLHLSRETEEAVNLTVMEDTEIVFVSRFVSRHMLNIDVIIGTRMPAYCTAPGIAMLSRLPESEAIAILQRSERKAHTPSTTWRMEDLVAKLRTSRLQGFATAFDEYYHGDASIAAAVLDTQGRPEGAVNVAVSLARFNREEARERFAPFVVATARSISAG